MTFRSFIFSVTCLAILSALGLGSGLVAQDSPIQTHPGQTISQQTTPVNQRQDSSFIMLPEQAKIADGNQMTWALNVEHPGDYILQLVLEAEEAKADVAATFSIDGKPHAKPNATSPAKSPAKNYLIEDGLVASFEQTVTLEKIGPAEVSVSSSIALKYARLVPAGYVKSRISLASRKYYQPWLTMHQSPEKVAAMQWYKRARFGMFIHWGVYSHAAGTWKGKRIEEGQGPKVAEWIMNAFQVPRDEYRTYAKNFKPDPSFAVNIAKLAKSTGMKYVVITSKHHDGFGLFESAHSKFDITDATDYQGDLIKELYNACRAEGLEFGVYYSHGNDWAEGGDGNYANVKKRDQEYGVSTRPNGKNLWDPSPNSHEDYLNNKAYPQVAELIRILPELRLIWFDGEGLITEAQAFKMYKMVYDLNPNIIVNRRIGYDFGDYVDAGDNKTPAANQLAAKHFETCGTANHSWGFKAHDDRWKTPHELLRNFVDIVSKGGNYLLNIGPDGTGAVPQPCVDNFGVMGRWVKTNADAIDGTTRWKVFNEGVEKAPERGPKPLPKTTEFWFSTKRDGEGRETVYAMSLAPAPKQVQIVSLGKTAGEISQLRLLGSDKNLQWVQTQSGLEVNFDGVVTDQNRDQNGYVLEATFVR